MESFFVKIETPEPVKFREYDEAHPCVDLLLEVRVAGTAEVSAFDAERYAGAEEAARAVEGKMLPLLRECLDAWQEGKPLMCSPGKAELAEMLEKKLAKSGVSAKVEFSRFALTEESQELFSAALKNEAERLGGALMWDHVSLIDNEGQPRPDQARHDSVFSGIYANALLIALNRQRRSGANKATDKFCRLCGAKRADNAKFCSNCGAKFGE